MTITGPISSDIRIRGTHGCKAHRTGLTAHKCSIHSHYLERHIKQNPKIILISSVFPSLTKRNLFPLSWGFRQLLLCVDTLHNAYNKIITFMGLWLLLFPVLLPEFFFLSTRLLRPTENKDLSYVPLYPVSRG